MSQHTPGPWTADGNFVHAHESKKTVATTFAGGGNGNEEFANAHLVAAAPDLLEACKKFVQWIDEGQPAETQNVVSDAEAAIAKATQG